MPIDIPINSLLNKADAEKVSEGLKSVKRNYLVNNILLPSTNLLCKNPGSVIKDNPGLTVDMLKEYIAVCTFVHTIDGWSYLSNAINSFLCGEPSIMMHLAYYGELRAAIAFLCSEGVLIANDQQACVDEFDASYIPIKQVKSLHINPSGTHNATWNIIDNWISDNTRPTDVLEYFTYQGRSFKDLVPFIPFADTTNPAQVVVVKGWLKTWCFDIQKYKGDKAVRNEVSYNPNILRSFSPINLKENLSALNKFWALLEPSTDNFSKLDLYLFSSYLNEIYNRTPNEYRTTKEDFINEFYCNSGLSVDSSLTKIFTSETCFLIEQANNLQVNPSTGEVFPLTIIARTILLLRLTCGACSFLFKKNDIQMSDLKFYIDKVGQDFGIWKEYNVDDLKDLWPEISDLLEDFSDYFEHQSPVNIFELKKTFAEYSEIYTQFTRAGFWGLGL